MLSLVTGRYLMQSSKPRLGTKQRTRGSIGIRKSKAEAMLHEKSDESIVAMKGGPMKQRTCNEDNTGATLGGQNPLDAKGFWFGQNLNEGAV